MSSNSAISEQLRQDDESKISRFHLRMIFTAGTGFFTDAYDLFIIGVVTALLGPIWHLNHSQLAILNAASLASAALGAIIYGYLSDKFGRKAIYGTEVLILFFGAIFSACSTSFTMLLIARIIVGFGIGGDYPSSAVVASEAAGRKHRGLLVLLVFAMQALGFIVGPFLASVLLAMHITPEHTWRMLLGFGAIPAASVFYLRWTIKESKHYLLNKKTAPLEVSSAVSDLAGFKPANFSYQKQSLFSKKWLKYLLGTAGAWFCMDVALYGNGVSNIMILKAIDPNATLLHHTIISSAIFLVFAVPGYFLAAMKVDKIGRKKLQYLGFAMMAVCFAAIAFIPSVIAILPLFISIYGLSYFFVNFGPNTTTFLIPSEIYPSSIRAKGHGTSAAIGKVGAFLGVYFLPGILHSYGLGFTLGLMGGVSLLGIGFTMLLPEMSNVSIGSTESIVYDESNVNVNVNQANLAAENID
jgi:MFS transporter, PHS family, inorganic phosphate transporter